jgi:hypothetical protein
MSKKPNFRNLVIALIALFVIVVIVAEFYPINSENSSIATNLNKTTLGTSISTTSTIAPVAYLRGVSPNVSASCIFKNSELSCLGSGDKKTVGWIISFNESNEILPDAVFTTTNTTFSFSYNFTIPYLFANPEGDLGCSKPYTYPPVYNWTYCSPLIVPTRFAITAIQNDDYPYMMGSYCLNGYKFINATYPLNSSFYIVGISHSNCLPNNAYSCDSNGCSSCLPEYHIGANYMCYANPNTIIWSQTNVSPTSTTQINSYPMDNLNVNLGSCSIGPCQINTSSAALYSLNGTLIMPLPKFIYTNYYLVVEAAFSGGKPPYTYNYTLFSGGVPAASYNKSISLKRYHYSIQSSGLSTNVSLNENITKFVDAGSITYPFYVHVTITDSLGQTISGNSTVVIYGGEI